MNAELAADRPIEVGFLPRGVALEDEDLIRTKVSLIPDVGDRDPRGRHRRARQAGRRGDPRPHPPVRSGASASRRPRTRGRATSGSASRWSMAERARAAEGGKLDALREALRRHERIIVAFSGGADSAFLARVAHDTLGAGRVRAVTAVSPSLAADELDDCRRLAADWGLSWTTVLTDEMERAAYRVNDGERCYHCKAALMDALAPMARSDAGAVIALGVNVDDLGRPSPGPAGGRRAGGGVPAGRGRLHQGGRARLVPPAGPADVGQAGRRLPGLAGAVRHRGLRGRAVTGGAGRGGAAAARASDRCGSATTTAQQGSRCPRRIWPASWPLGSQIVASPYGLAGLRLRHPRPLEGLRSGTTA